MRRRRAARAEEEGHGTARHTGDPAAGRREARPQGRRGPGRPRLPAQLPRPAASWPRRRPTPASPRCSARRSSAARHEAQSDEQARDMAHTLNRTVLTIKRRAGIEDKLYGSVTSTDISDAIWKARKIRIDRRKVELDEPIKTLGSHRVQRDRVRATSRAVLKVMVVPGGADEEGGVEAFEAEPSEPSRASSSRSHDGGRRQHEPTSRPRTSTPRSRCSARCWSRRTRSRSSRSCCSPRTSTAARTRPSTARSSRCTARARTSTRSRSRTRSPTAALLDEVGGKAVVHTLAATVPAAANARHYAQIVRDTATYRGLIRAGTDIASLGYEHIGEPPRARRPGRADRVRDRRPAHHRRLRAHRDAAQAVVRAARRSSPRTRTAT